MPEHIEQPLPTPNGGRSIQSMVRADLLDAIPPVAADVSADLLDREQLGIERYGTYLQANNGRDALRDAYEECLDLAVYLKQAIVEGHDLVIAYYATLTMAMHIKENMLARDAAKGTGDAAV
ncbi:hypothetical protein [Micromonospora sp. NPDC047730]|uniref:hypothetical protein n=1 Tax=Micromonospora sp. NPDC047730 TaxID=3364253 RepID=UPI003719F63A